MCVRHGRGLIRATTDPIVQRGSRHISQIVGPSDPLPPVDCVATLPDLPPFFGTTLASTLTAMGVDTLLITGLSTSGCVRATALDACQHGFLPFVVREACGDRHPGPHEANLFDLQAKYAEVITEAQAIAQLQSISPA